jgi:hypothetical protein
MTLRELVPDFDRVTLPEMLYMALLNKLMYLQKHSMQMDLTQNNSR